MERETEKRKEYHDKTPPPPKPVLKQQLSFKTHTRFKRALTLNPVIAPACTISWLKDAGMCLQTVSFSALYHITVRVFDGNPFTC